MLSITASKHDCFRKPVKMQYNVNHAFEELFLELFWQFCRNLRNVMYICYNLL
jgi:hypothetical protein